MAIKRPSDTPHLKPETIAILLAGWGSSPPAHVAPGPHGFCGGMLRLFDSDGRQQTGLVETWNEHRVYLEGVAREWGWRPRYRLPDGSMGYYAQACAAGDGWAGEVEDEDV